MFENNHVRWGIVAFAFIAAAVFLLPNFYTFKEGQWWFSKTRLIYGLDIQGGLHLVMGVKTNEAIYEKIKTLTPDLKTAFKAAGVEAADIKVLKKPVGQIKVLFKNPADLDQAKKAVQKQYTAGVLGGTALRVLEPGRAL